jgi:transposase
MDRITHIGLDVHKDTIAVATLKPGNVSPEERVIPNTPDALRKLVSRLGDPSLLKTCYEAGPCAHARGGAGEDRPFGRPHPRSSSPRG